MNLLVSACLLGVNCRYCGDGKPCAEVLALRKKYSLVPVCPEQLGGLPTPRPPVELQNGHAIDRAGNDRTEAFQRGAQETLKIARIFGCRSAVLKSKSPSCGCGKIYDGTFSGKLTEGCGITAGLLQKEGLHLLDEENAAAELKKCFPKSNAPV